MPDQLIHAVSNFNKSPAKPVPWLEVEGIKLNKGQKLILESPNDWLDDRIITASHELLKKQYPTVDGLQTRLLDNNLHLFPQHTNLCRS